MSTDTGLPDLLHRFVETPHRCEAILRSAIVSFETNDHELLKAFREKAEQLAGVLVSSDMPWHWKVIRDYDVSQDGNDSFLLDAGTLTTLSLGTGTVVAIDWENGELLGFIAANVPTQYLLDALLEIGLRHRLHHANDSNLRLTLQP